MRLVDCDPVGIVFTFICDGRIERLETEYFEVNSLMERDIEAFCDEWIDDRDEEWELDDREVVDWDDDYNPPDDFSDFNKYGDYCVKCAQPGYKERFEDIGDFDYDEQYNGSWGSEEEFAQQLYEDCYDIPDHLSAYIDWEKLTRDIMMDYSSYYVDGEYHIFRDC